MERKNIVFVAKSLDGYIAGVNGELDWLNNFPNPNKDDFGFNHLMNHIDAIVMGRNTFEMVCGLGGKWPYHKPLFVLTSALKKIPIGLKGKVTLLNDSPQRVIDRIHAKGLFKLYIDGGMTVQFFLEKDLIDELIITTIPILLGNGIPLFGILSKSLGFNHVNTEVFLNEMVQSKYVRKSYPPDAC